MSFRVKLVFLSSMALFAMPVYAIDISSLNAQQMVVNLAQQIPQIINFVTALAYVIGLYFVVTGIIKLKHFGEQRTMMSSEHSLTSPLAYIFAGTMLIYLPSSIQVGLSTFWSNPNPYGYVPDSDQWQQFIGDCMLILQLFGIISFIRGLVILSKVGGHGGHQDGFGKGITHIIGGIFCINIYQFVQVIMNTLGIQS